MLCSREVKIALVSEPNELTRFEGVSCLLFFLQHFRTIKKLVKKLIIFWPNKSQFEKTEFNLRQICFSSLYPVGFMEHCSNLISTKSGDSSWNRAKMREQKSVQLNELHDQNSASLFCLPEKKSLNNSNIRELREDFFLKQVLKTPYSLRKVFKTFDYSFFVPNTSQNKRI